ncbi:MAG: MarR family transcriptional regulator [Peptococcaceae bacterium]|nr:MarR family transcriptional regulator [Peptococcaceae bacterium]
MDYTDLAADFLDTMNMLRNAQFQKDISESMRGELFILQYITQHEDLVLPSAISHEMNISSARITAILNNMEDKGLVTREIDRSDRRRILIRLTQPGKDLADYHRQKVITHTIHMLSLLGEQDAREYVRLTKKLASELDGNIPP